MKDHREILSEAGDGGDHTKKEKMRNESVGHSATMSDLQS